MTESDDLEHFFQSMADVTPIKTDKRVSLNKESVSAETLRARRDSATSENTQAEDRLSGDYVGKVEPNAVLAFQRPGIQHGVFRNLRLGKYNIEASLDLHRHTIDEARVALFTFIKDCQQYDVRCALITHGKGEGRKDGALLKSCVDHWLPQLEQVLAYHTAQNFHGAGGATYVLLKRKKAD